jgi:hypothetical protein
MKKKEIPRFEQYFIWYPVIPDILYEAGRFTSKESVRKPLTVTSGTVRREFQSVFGSVN